MTYKHKNNLVDIEVRVFMETDKALLVSCTDDRDDAVWVPKSQAELADGLLTCPEWLAIEKRLI